MKYMKSNNQTIIFEISNSANILGSGTLPVIATPAMIDCFNAIAEISEFCNSSKRCGSICSG
jgi:predicted thioesterase